jgi:hypothetical protein
MDCPKQIILVSWSAELKVRFNHQVDVTNKKIALSSIQYPYVMSADHQRTKRLIKDRHVLGEVRTALVLCDAIRENAIINDIKTSSASFPLRSMDMIQLQTRREYTVIEVKNPVFHEFSASTFLGLTVRLCDLNGEKIKFNGGGIVVIKLLIE